MSIFLSRRSRCVVLAAAFVSMHAAGAAEPACAPVFDAMEKLAATPNHSHSTMTMPGRSAPATGESISTAQAVYIRASGPWRQRPRDSQKDLADLKAARSESKAICKRMRAETVEGEASTLYAVHDATEDGSMDQQVWISDTRGLPLRQTVDIDEVHSHQDVLYDYRDVQPPVAAEHP